MSWIQIVLSGSELPHIALVSAREHRRTRVLWIAPNILNVAACALPIYEINSYDHLAAGLAIAGHENAAIRAEKKRSSV